jgi:periplasmic divalent cation tolerance protein
MTISARSLGVPELSGERRSMAHGEALCVSTTTETSDQADSLARALVERRLAACVQVQGPIRSTYWWDGCVQQSQEWLCVAKTTKEKYAEVEQTVRALHAYDEPEIIAVPIVAGSPGYLSWLQTELSKDR